MKQVKPPVQPGEPHKHSINFCQHCQVITCTQCGTVWNKDGMNFLPEPSQASNLPVNQEIESLQEDKSIVALSTTACNEQKIFLHGLINTFQETYNMTDEQLSDLRKNVNVGDGKAAMMIFTL